MLVSVGADLCLVTASVSVSVWILNLTLLIEVIQGQDNSDIDLFGSVVMSNVCGCTIDS